ADDIGDSRIFVVLSEYDRDREVAQQRHEGRRLETVVPHFHDMAQCVPVESRRQQFEETTEIRFIEFLEWRELPEEGAEAGAQFGDAGIVKPLDGIAGLAEHPAVDGVAGTLE